MTRGKQTCRILKEIRCSIAEANDISLAISECSYQGDCTGTCPRCEAEVRFLEHQLRLRRLAGKAVVLAGLSTALAPLTGCTPQSASAPAIEVQQDSINTACTDELIEGDIDFPDKEDIREVELDTSVTVDSSEAAISAKDMDSAEDLNNIIVGEVNSELPKDDGIYEIFQVPYKPGVAEIDSYIQKNIHYPDEAVAQGASGKVVIEVIIDSLGNITQPRIVKWRHPALDKTALDLEKSMKAVEPCKLEDGTCVNCRLTIPISFKIQQD